MRTDDSDSLRHRQVEHAFANTHAWPPFTELKWRSFSRYDWECDRRTVFSDLMYREPRIKLALKRPEKTDYLRTQNREAFRQQLRDARAPPAALHLFDCQALQERIRALSLSPLLNIVRIVQECAPSGASPAAGPGAQNPLREPIPIELGCLPSAVALPPPR